MQKRSEAEWREIISEQRGSGKSKAGWCREKGLALSTFTQWSKRIGKGTSEKTPSTNLIKWEPHTDTQESKATLSENNVVPGAVKISRIEKKIEIEIKPGIETAHLENILLMVNRL
jgi:hypothetical protein